ncbi:MAG: isochorismatase family protein [Candidatus Aenigmarchaeota archaeon]|nr:isochorismatase family protein [Candidatus Aenigmarchaeota archaeon]
MRKLSVKELHPKKTLILVIDLQNDFCHERSVLKRKRTRNRRCALSIYRFVEKAKRKGVEIAFSQQVYDESKLTAQQKKYYAQLTFGERKTFGAYKGQIKIPCVKGSFGAEERGFNIVVPEDLVSGVDHDLEAQKNLLKIIGEFYGAVVSSAEIEKIWNKYY